MYYTFEFDENSAANMCTSFIAILFSIYIFKLISFIDKEEGIENIRLFSSKIKNIIRNKKNTNKQQNKVTDKIKIGLLTNEIPPIVYGGVATWIVNFLDMFKNDPEYEVIPIYLAYQDLPPNEFNKYKDLRIIYNADDIQKCFDGIDVCINNIWISLETIKDIKRIYPDIPMISICHSLIQMEHKTNLGSQYTVTWKDQEVTFQNSDFVVLISEAEKKYYMHFNYNKFSAIPIVIYNSYKPKYDNVHLQNNYNLDDPGYIGRHVPRKRPELPLFAVEKIGNKDVKIINMGVDYKNGSNDYWEKLETEHKQLEIIPFSSDPKLKAKYWNNVGVNCITGIYEPFGYTICETLDRRVPCIVQNIDGPSEIIKGFEEHVITYKVDMDMEKDIENFSQALNVFWNKSEKERKEMAEKARKSLDRFRPEVIKQDWKHLLDKCFVTNSL